MSFNNLNKAFYVGDVLVPGILSLGPMAGVTDVSFRSLCADMGCDLLYTEMVSAKGIYYNNKNTEELLKVNENEHPIALQLFGNDGELMGAMAAKLEDRPFEIIDINMGCPVPKVVGNKEGSYIMTDPDLAYSVVSGIARQTKKPVSVKIRKGFEVESAVEVAKACESAGAKLVAVHGRLRTEYYQGISDWGCIKRVKDAVSIPVIGSGDVKTEEDMVRMLNETGCDGVMIARAARGNPFIFKRFKHYLLTGEKLDRPGADDVAKMCLYHAKCMCNDKGELMAMREMRKHVAWYFQGYPHSAKLRGQVNEIETYADLEELLSGYFL